MSALYDHLNEFVDIPKEDLNALVELFHPKSIKKGESWSPVGEPATKIGFVQSGVFRAYHLGSDGQEFRSDRQRSLDQNDKSLDQTDIRVQIRPT